MLVPSVDVNAGLLPDATKLAPVRINPLTPCASKSVGPAKVTLRKPSAATDADRSESKLTSAHDPVACVAPEIADPVSLIEYENLPAP